MRIKNKKKQKKENFEIDEVVRINNFLRINSEKMFADALNQIRAKKNMKESWKIKWKIIFQKRDYRKVQNNTNEGGIRELNKKSRWKYNFIFKNSMILSFSLIIFLAGKREMIFSWK